MRIQLILITTMAAALMSVSYASERDALQALYEALGGAQWERSGGWMTNTPVGDWLGVDVRDGHVVGINLADNGLAGELPEAIAELAHIERLDLRWSALTGVIPASISALTSLKTLLLSGNQLHGERSGRL